MGLKLREYDCMELGREKGIVEGEKRTQIKNAISLLDILDNEMIAEKMGLTIFEVAKLRKENAIK